MENIREHVYLAALLHDIGKFYQRADVGDILLDETSIKTDFGYQHTLWTLKFLHKMETVLNKVPGLVETVNYETKNDSVFQLARHHHTPNTELQYLISMADWWSAGIDRMSTNLEVESGDKDGISWGSKRYKKIPLYSVFNKINHGNFSSAFGLKPLSIEETGFFPSDIKKVDDGNTEEEYKKLWGMFVEEFNYLPTDSFDGFAESLLFLLKKYTWCIPSNTTNMSNVSLFDHLKTTAAFADSLYVYWSEYQDDFTFNGGKLTLKEDVKPVILLGGDLSGIQKFIYNIASRKAAVSLKGRSFYLQLLIDSIIQRFLSHPDIKATLAHVVYSSGGKFYMVLPNTQKVTDAIKSIKNDIESLIWKEHHGQLIVNIDYVPFAYNSNNGLDFDDKVNQPIGELWRTLAEKLTNQKNLKFKALLLDKYDEFFKEKEVGKMERVCAVTGIESDKLVAIDPKEKGEKTYVLPIVKKQVELGNVLKDADYIITYQGSCTNKYLSNHSKFQISCVGVDNYLFDNIELFNRDADFMSINSKDVFRVKQINQSDNFLIPLKGNGCGYGFQFYGGNNQAQTLDKESKYLRNKTFEELAGDTYLGILRMDVDNLGSIFIKGLPEEDKSFAAYSTLSFMLDYFFSGFLNTIRSKECFEDDVNILYSGGDDVFAVGRWDKLILFAEEIRKNFRKFVGRDDISISGGIAMVGEKFPISKAAEMAGDAEDAAKKYNNSAKNAFNVFGESVAWNENEFGYVKSYKQQFVDLINDYGLSRGILHKVMAYAAIVKENQVIAKENKEGKNKRKPNLSYLWHTAYYLTRYMEANKSNAEVVAFCKDLRDKQLQTPEKFRLMSLAARWAELELRMKDK